MTFFDKLDRSILRNIKVEHIIKKEKEPYQDHIEVGQVSKGGVIKVYGDFNKPDEFKEKINKALELRTYANTHIYPPSKDDTP